jgi:catechol 2,3-dioxygenase-like lactoylglutathione lyase family enzyme
MEVTGPTIDAQDVVALARFYERLLGWDVVALEGPRDGYPADDAWAKLAAPDRSMKLEIQFEQHYVAPVWPTEPGAPQMMIHLDIAVDDLDAGVRWALDCGATLATHQPQEGVRVMLDPAGHPFCLFAEA